MSQTVAEVLVNALESIGVKHIFGLIGDSLNPLADAVRRSAIEWVGVRHEEGGALAAAGQAKLTGQLGVCCGTTGPGRILSPVSTKWPEITRRCWRSRATPILFRPLNPICCFATFRSTPKRFRLRRRHRPSFIRPSPHPMGDAASPI